MSQLSTEFKVPYFIERAKTETLNIPIYQNGALVAPTSGTITITDGSGTAIVDAQEVTITASIATYSLTAAEVPATLSLSDNWLVEWDLLISSEEHIFRNEAQLVLRSFYPVISDVDLTNRHSDLLNLTDDANLQAYIDISWDKIQVDLIDLGKRPNLIISTYSLKEPHTNLALSFIFRDQSTYSSGTSGKYTSLADFYKEQYERDMESLKLVYDYDEDNIISDDEKGVAGQPVIYLSKTPWSSF